MGIYDGLLNVDYMSPEEYARLLGAESEVMDRKFYDSSGRTPPVVDTWLKLLKGQHYLQRYEGHRRVRSNLAPDSD